MFNDKEVLGELVVRVAVIGWVIGRVQVGLELEKEPN